MNTAVIPETQPARLFPHSCETMPELGNGSVDLIVTSPPYWVSPDDPLLQSALLRGLEGTPKHYEALLNLLARCFAECFRVLKPGGVAAVNVASTLVKGKLYPLPFDLCTRLMAAGWELREEIVWRRWRGWDRRGGVVIQKPYPGYFFPNRIFEYVLVLRKPGPPIYAGRSAEEKQASRIVVDDLLFHEINNSVWNVLPVRPQQRARAAKRGIAHPCPFPDELAYRLVTLYSYRGDTVLDPFAGSGTTAKVALHTGRNFVGYEVNPEFVALAKERIREPALNRERRVCRFVALEPCR